MSKQPKVLTTRRDLLAASGLLLVGTSLARSRDVPAVELAPSAEECTVFTKARQEALTPQLALARLKAGNARFIAGQSENCDLRMQVHDTAKGLAPFAAVLGCMDSRVPPELVFDQRIGDIFAIRIAGNFVNQDIAGSLEYATKVAGAKLIVVLGHTDCGAIKGAIDDVKLGNLTATLANIRPCVSKVAAREGKSTSADKKFVQAVTVENVRGCVGALLTRSAVLADLVSKGQLAVAKAVHDVGNGVVTWLA